MPFARARAWASARAILCVCGLFERVATYAAFLSVLLFTGISLSLFITKARNSCEAVRAYCANGNTLVRLRQSPAGYRYQFAGVRKMIEDKGWLLMIGYIAAFLAVLVTWWLYNGMTT